jgi:hypothetical protein
VSSICRWATGEVLRGVERSSASVALAAAPSREAAAPGATTAQSRVVSACTASGTWALKNHAIHFLLGQTAKGGQHWRPTSPPADLAHASIGRYGSPYGLTCAPTHAHLTKRLGRSLDASI